MPFIKKAQEPYPPIPDTLLRKISSLAQSEAREVCVDAFPGYAVTEDGQIWSVRKANSHTYGNPKKRKLHPYPFGGGFLGVGLADDHGIMHTLSVSRLVAITFIGDPPTPDHLAIHTDGDIKNNHVANLKWATWAEMGENKARHDSMKAQGVEIANTKITEAQAREIASRLEYESDDHIAKDYGVSRSVVEGIRTGKTWKYLNLSSPRTKRFSYGGERSHFSKLTEQQVREIRQRRAGGASNKELAQVYGISEGYVSYIVRGKYWKHVK